MANSKRRCTHCKKYSLAVNGIVCGAGFFCDNECRITYGLNNIPTIASKAKKENEKRKQEKRTKRLAELKPKSEYLKAAQAEFNKFIRLRDADKPCISCQRWHSGQYHAGHYRSVGSAAELRFNEENVHRQCAPCNNHLSGNLIGYRANLIKKIGLDRVELLEGKHEPKKYNVEQIKEIKELYKSKVKNLLKNQAA